MSSQVLWAINNNAQVSIYDLPTGTCLKSFKPLSEKKESNLIYEPIDIHKWKAKATTTGGIVGEWLIVLPRDKSVVYFHHYQYMNSKKLSKIDPSHPKDGGPWFKVIAAERWNAFTITNDKNFVLASSGSAGKLYVWQLVSGHLLTTFMGHFQPIIDIKFSVDDKICLALTMDGCIKAWYLNDLITGQHDPIYTLSHTHSKMIMEIWIGKGLYHQSVLVTASLDNSCKLFDLVSGELLATFLFPDPILTVIMDPLETALIAGSIVGDIYTFPVNTNMTQLKNCHLKGAQGLIYTMNLDDNNTNQSLSSAKKYLSQSLFSGHKSAVISLSISLTMDNLISADIHGNIYIWDMTTRMKLRSINTSSTEPVIFTQITLLPSFLNNNPLMEEICKSEVAPIIRPFERTVTPLNYQTVVPLYPKGFEKVEQMWDNQLKGEKDLGNPNLSKKDNEIGENKAMKESLCKLTRMNELMYEALVNQVLQNNDHI